tara:strand:+ start:76 stop:933 length:858 start_codon:yes stop_codon:yes gene_type:complete
MENIPILGWFIQSFNKCISIGILNSSCGLLVLFTFFIIFGILNAIEDYNKKFIKLSLLFASLNLIYLAYYLDNNYDISIIWLCLIYFSAIASLVNFLTSTVGDKRINKIVKKIPDRFIKIIVMIPYVAIFVGLLYLLNDFLNNQFANKTLVEVAKSTLDALTNTASTAGSIILGLIAIVVIFGILIGVVMFFGSKIVNRIENILNIENEFERKWKALIFVLISIGLLYLAANIEKHYFPFGDITFFSTLFIIFGSISAFIYIFTFIGIIFDKIKKILDYLTDKYR